MLRYTKKFSWHGMYRTFPEPTPDPKRTAKTTFDDTVHLTAEAPLQFLNVYTDTRGFAGGLEGRRSQACVYTYKIVSDSVEKDGYQA